jgi:hypothetical protein
MAEPDNFILRWARRRSDIERTIEATRIDSAIEPKEPVPAEATTAQPRIDAAADEPFDLSSLPSIEAITANTDVRGFLQSRVPSELTRAALRKAWTSDPNAIPGFGPLEMTGNETAVLTHALGKLESVSERFLQSSASDGQGPSSATGDQHSVVHETAEQKVAELPSVDTGVSSDLNEKRGTEEKLESAHAAENHDHFRNRRRHGSAWPH